jgi:hypothetical protein
VSELSTTLTEAFDVSSEEGSGSFEPIPRGSYIASIIDAKAGALKSGKGQSVNLTWQIEGGEYSGRLIFDRVIVRHESSAAMKYGRRRLKDVADAVGVTTAITDLSVLLSKPVCIFVKIEHDQAGDFPPRNTVGRVRPLTKPSAPTAV